MQLLGHRREQELLPLGAAHQVAEEVCVALALVLLDERLELPVAVEPGVGSPAEQRPGLVEIGGLQGG